MQAGQRLRQKREELWQQHARDVDGVAHHGHGDGQEEEERDEVDKGDCEAEEGGGEQRLVFGVVDGVSGRELLA